MPTLLQRNDRTTWRRAGAWTLIASFVVATAPSVAADPQRSGSPAPAIKTRAAAGPLDALASAFFSFDDQVRSSNGKPPSDAGRRLDELQRLAGPAAAEIRSFVNRLRQANEADAFEALVYQRAGQSGRPALAGEIKGLGGPLAVLGRADGLLGDLMAEHRKAAAGPGVSDLLDAIGLTTSLKAGILSTACGAFFFTISVGYGDRFAYRACYY